MTRKRPREEFEIATLRKEIDELKEELHDELEGNNRKMMKECEELEKRLRITKGKGKKNLILNISYQIQLFITI